MSSNAESPGLQSIDPNVTDLGELIAVVDDEKVESQPDPQALANVLGAVFGVLPLSAVVVGAAGLGAVSVWSWRRRRDSTETSSIVRIPRSDIRRLVSGGELQFPLGEPVVGQVYVRHPVRSGSYWPFAEFHQLLVQEKTFEIARYLIALGAGDINVECKINVGKSSSGETVFRTPTPADVSASLGFAQGVNGALSISITGPGNESDIPGDLVWPNNDPLFKLARESASAGVKTFKVGMATNQTNSVNAEVAATIPKFGLSAGGTYKRWEDLTFVVQARFE